VASRYTWHQPKELAIREQALEEDIGRRQQAGSAPHDGELQFRRLLEKLPAGAYTCDPEGLITYFNQRAVQLWGRAPKLSDPIDRFCGSFKLFSPDGSPVAHDECWMALALKTDKEYNRREIVIERPDGQRLTALAYANPIHDGSGKLIGAVNVLVDISDRKRAEDRVLFQAHLLEQVQAAVIATDMRGIVTHWNEHAEKLYGWTREEAMGRNITELTVGPEEAGLAEGIMEGVRSGATWEGEFEVRRRDGSRFLAHVTDSLIRDAEGQAVGIVGVSTDITERKRTEEELRESEERFRAFFETAAVGAAQADPTTGRFLQVNEKLCRFLGYAREELLSMTSSDVTHPDHWARDLEGLSRLLRGEVREYTAEKRYVRKDGQTVWGQLALSLVRDGDGRALHTVAITKDITARRAAEEALLEIREAERRRIARDLHDVVLQDLTGTLQGMQAAQVESENMGSSAGLEQEIAALRRAVEGLRNAIYDLRLEKWQPFVRAVESLVELNRQLTPEREIRLTVRDGFPPGLPDDADVELLRVLQEALANARRHSGAKSVEVKLRMEAQQILVEVIDDGRGFDPASVREGLGISGMRERALALEGKLEVESEPGKGTSVKVEIPL
jgi:PAS domain S-box-containing protein